MLNLVEKIKSEKITVSRLQAGIDSWTGLHPDG